MFRRLIKLALLVAAAAGGVVAWQRKNETPATAPTPLRPAEPFMTPAPAPAAVSGAAPASVEPGADTEVAAALAAVEDEPVAGVGGAPSAGTLAPAAEGAPDPLPGPPRGAPADPLPTPPREPATGGGDDLERPGGDDLKRLSGVGPKIEKVLHEEGITTFAQLAALDEDGIDALQARLPQFPGRIRRDDWVGQAKRLVEG